MMIYVGGSKNIDNLPECVQTRLKELVGEKNGLKTWGRHGEGSFVFPLSS